MAAGFDPHGLASEMNGRRLGRKLGTQRDPRTEEEEVARGHGNRMPNLLILLLLLLLSTYWDTMVTVELSTDGHPESKALTRIGHQAEAHGTDHGQRRSSPRCKYQRV